MKLHFESRDLEIDAWLREFAWTSAAFATWHHEMDVEEVRIVLNRERDHDGSPYVRCGIRARTPRGMLSAGAAGDDAREAIQEACDLLEASVRERMLGFRRRRPRRKAFWEVPRLEPAAAAAALPGPARALPVRPGRNRTGATHPGRPGPSAAA